MRYFWWLVRIGLFVAIVGFAVKNSDTVAVRYYLGAEWRAPLAFVLLTVFGLGVGLGVLAGMGRIYRQRREIAALRRALDPAPGGQAPGAARARAS